MTRSGLILCLVLGACSRPHPSAREAPGPTRWHLAIHLSGRVTPPGWDGAGAEWVEVGSDGTARYAFAPDLADSAFAYRDWRPGAEATRTVLRRVLRVVGPLRFDPADRGDPARFAASVSGAVDGQWVQVPLDPGAEREVRAILDPLLRAAARRPWTHDPRSAR